MDASVSTGSPSAARPAILVHGMHASGTSLLACLVFLLTRRRFSDAGGAKSFPHIRLGGAIAGLNRRILQELGSSWSRPAVLFLRGKGVAESAPVIADAIRRRYVRAAVGILRSGTTGEPVILEDPGLCLLRDLWQAALQELGLSVRALHIFRNPLEVAASLRESQGLLHSQTLRLWVHYNLAALNLRSGEEHPLVLSYRELMDPASQLMTRLALALDLPLPNGDGHQTAWQALLHGGPDEAVVPDRVVERSPLVPSLVKRLHRLLATWESHDREGRADTLRDLACAFEDQSLFAGNFVAVQPPEPANLGAPLVSAATGRRGLLIHYHLFKNAGTSVDAILAKNFGDAWINTEFPPCGAADHHLAVRAFISDNAHLAAISSHSLLLPIPEIEGIDICPILFIRHPLDRMKSAYEFERRQDATAPGARYAKNLSFAEYIRLRLATAGDRSCRDFQASRLAMALPAGAGSEWDRALAALDRLPFVGLVEAFRASAERLQRLVQAMVPGFRSFEVKANATQTRRGSLEERLAQIQIELGEEGFALAMEANRADLALHGRVRAIYGLASIPAALEAKLRA
jgi:hypothetical protein